MGLSGMGGAAGAGDAMQTLFQQRMQAAQLAQQAEEFKQQQAQQDALTRLKFQEQADAVRARMEVAAQADKDRDAAREQLGAVRAEAQAKDIPYDEPITGAQVQDLTGRGASPALFQPMPIQNPDLQPPRSIAAPESGVPGIPDGMPGTVANSPAPNLVQFHRIPTAQERSHARDEANKLAMHEDPIANHEANRLFDVAHPMPRADSPTADRSRLDKSYDTQTKRIDAMEKPIADQAERIGRLRTTMNQMSPQADAFLAPEALTAFAGGIGSGLRMNEAEIERIVGGRTQWGDLKAKLEAWHADESKPFAITVQQRKQLRDLVRAIAERAERRLSMLDDARSQLVDATDVVAHRRIVDGLKKRFNAEALGTDMVPSHHGAPASAGVPAAGSSLDDVLAARRAAAGGAH